MLDAGGHGALEMVERSGPVALAVEGDAQGDVGLRDVGNDALQCGDGLADEGCVGDLTALEARAAGLRPPRAACLR